MGYEYGAGLIGKIAADQIAERQQSYIGQVRKQSLLKKLAKKFRK